MIRAWFLLLIIVCPANAGEISIPCDKDGWCLVHIELMKALIARSEMNCGPK